MLRESLAALFRRDLATLTREIEAYPDEAAIWVVAPGITNSGGMLVRHLAGNLQHFIGAVLGGSGYRRDREAEFGAPPWPRAALLAEVGRTDAIVATTLERLDPARLDAPYPELVLQQRLMTGDFLTHLAVHLAFHVGQVDYHRRLVTGHGASVGPTAIPALASARPADPVGRAGA